MVSGLASDVQYKIHQAVKVRTTNVLTEPGIVIMLTNIGKLPGLYVTSTNDDNYRNIDQAFYTLNIEPLYGHPPHTLSNSITGTLLRVGWGG